MSELQSELLIGLYGPSRSGKDSIAKFLVQDFGFTQRNMADTIRNILLDMNPFLQDSGGEFWRLQDLFKYCGHNWDEIKAQSTDSVDLMIGLGQACRDHLDYDIWLNTVLKDRPNRLCIADVRQPNEYHAIKARGGLIWKVVRPGTEKRGMDGLLDGYDFDVFIENRGPLSDLRGQVQATISSYIHGMYIQKNDFLK